MPVDPDVCLYHDPCQDGFTAAWAVWRRFGDSVRYIPVNYRQDPPPGLLDLHVVIVDFSYKAPEMRAIARIAASVTVLDHHETAEKELTPLLLDGTVQGAFDMKRSGAMMAWRWAHPHSRVPALVRYVQDRDLWRFELSGSRGVAAAIFSHPYEFRVWDVLAQRCEENPHGLMLEGDAIQRARKKEIAETVAATTQWIQLGGFRVPAANLPKAWGSEACDDLAANQPFAAYYFDRADGRREFGLRSRPGGAVTAENVAAIAEQYGGGGHANAAGFIVQGGWLGDASGVPRS